MSEGWHHSPHGDGGQHQHSSRHCSQVWHHPARGGLPVPGGERVQPADPKRERRGSSPPISALAGPGFWHFLHPAPWFSPFKTLQHLRAFPSQIEQERLDKVWPKLRVLDDHLPPTNILWLKVMEWARSSPCLPPGPGGMTRGGVAVTSIVGRLLPDAQC